MEPNTSQWQSISLNEEMLDNVPMKESAYTVVSVFSGAMGLDIGLDKTNRYRILACVEKEHSFCETIRANISAKRLNPTIKLFEADVCKVKGKDILEAIGLKKGELDLLVGGPPCQSFSTAGKRMAAQDPRGTLLWQFIRLIEEIQPKYFLMENVRGLLSAALNHRSIAKRPDRGGRTLSPDEQPGSVVRLFAEDLQKISGGPYHMDCFEVNAVNYGAPQLRERALFIGNRYGSVVSFPQPTHGPNQPTNSQLPLFSSERKMKPWRTIGDALQGLSEKDPVRMDFSPRKKKFLSMVPPGSNWRSLPKKYQQESMGKAWKAKGGRSGWWRRLSYDLPCPTLVTMPNHASTALCHPAEVRALTLREYMRIQEFPNNWEVLGSPSEQFAQIGNAVPVRLGMVAGDVIAKQLDVLRVGKWKKAAHFPESYRVIYVQSHVRTRSWFKHGKTLIWTDGDKGIHPVYDPPKTQQRVRVLI